MSAVLAGTRAELTKIRTLRSGWIVTGIVLGVQVLALLQAADLTANAVAAITPDGVIEMFVGERRPATEAILEYLVASSFQMVQFLPILAAVLAGQEFRSHQLGLTVLAIPRRGRLLVAKTLAAAGYLCGVAILIAGMSTAFMYAAIKDWNPGLLLTDGALFGQLKFVGYAVLFSLITFAITIIARSTLVGIVVTLVLMMVTLTEVLAAAAPAVDALFPISAGRNLLLDAEQTQLSAGAGHGLLVMIAWVVATTTIAAITLDRRDAR